MNDTAQKLMHKIENRQATVGILGLGYVGLPLALAFSKAGFPVLGFDVDDRKVDQLNRGESYIAHIKSAAVAEASGGGRLTATADFSRLGEPHVLLICVPTPLTSQREPDMTYVVSTAEAIAKALRPGQLVALESTTYPGTTEELLRELLETSGLTCCEDFFLAYSPEREDPGNPDFATKTIPKVVGGVDETSTDLAVALYSPVVVETVRVSSARTAEAAKLLENIFRAVNIALVNELKIVYDA
ncbi:MAG: nucleotide sugar dehydrogenase, partial [Thermoanaerobaculia bacterium]